MNFYHCALPLDAPSFIIVALCLIVAFVVGRTTKGG